MPNGSDGLDFCRRLKAHRQTRLIPILIITSVQGIDNEVAYLDSGADEFLTKPLQPAIVRTRVKTMLRNKRVVDSLEEAETILFALAVTVEQRDKETGSHCQRLAALSVSLGKALGLPNDDLLALYRGGFLHDIGKIAVPDSILFKRGMLNEEEWSVMRSHTWKGEQICSPMRSLKPVLPVIRNHHERWDGTGYPDGLAGETIPLLARILQLADIYDALTSRRSYKSAYTPEEAVAMIREGIRDGLAGSRTGQCFLRDGTGAELRRAQRGAVCRWRGRRRKRRAPIHARIARPNEPRTSEVNGGLPENLVRNERADIRQRAHVGELNHWPRPAAGLAPHDRHCRHALHGERKEHQQGRRASRGEVALQRLLQADCVFVAFQPVDRAQRADNHLARRKRRDQPDADPPVKAQRLNHRFDGASQCASQRLLDRRRPVLARRHAGQNPKQNRYNENHRAGALQERLAAVEQTQADRSQAGQPVWRQLEHKGRPLALQHG